MEFQDFVVQYGLEFTLMAFAVIFMIGVVKLVFNKKLSKLSKGARKPIYESLSLVLAYGIVFGWSWIYAKYLGGPAFKLTLALEKASITYVAVKVMYPVYENYGLRELVRVIGKWIISLFSRKKKVKEAEDNNDSKIIIL